MVLCCSESSLILLLFSHVVYQVLATCSAIKNYYEPLKRRIDAKQKARKASQEANFNLQEIKSFEVKAEGSGVNEWFGMKCSKAKLKRMAPTHARITTPYVPMGMFTEEQRERVYEIPLVEIPDEGGNFSNRFGMPGREPI
jgi:hypothetical protein